MRCIAQRWSKALACAVLRTKSLTLAFAVLWTKQDKNRASWQCLRILSSRGLIHRIAQYGAVIASQTLSFDVLPAGYDHEQFSTLPIPSL